MRAEVSSSSSGRSHAAFTSKGKLSGSRAETSPRPRMRASSGFVADPWCGRGGRWRTIMRLRRRRSEGDFPERNGGPLRVRWWPHDLTVVFRRRFEVLSACGERWTGAGSRVFSAQRGVFDGLFGELFAERHRRPGGSHGWSCASALASGFLGSRSRRQVRGTTPAWLR